MTTHTHVSVFDTTLQKTHDWLEALTQLGDFETHEQAYTAMRAVLHALRDRLTVDEVAHLAAQLPMIIRGFYYEGWRPSMAPNKFRTREEFLDHVRQSLRNNTTINPQEASTAVFALLQEKISGGEVQQIIDMLPPPVRELWPGQ